MDWFEAARAGALGALEEHLGHGQDVDQRTADGRTALRLAAESGQTEVVKRLLPHGADPNLDAPGAGRPLRAAVENEHWETAAALVRGGADPNADGVASIVIAAPPKRQLLALMLKRGLDPHGSHEQWGPYIQFALNDAACCDMLFDAGFDVTRYEREVGESLLERALSNDVARFHDLLKRGANVNLPIDCRTGQTMLMFLAAEEPGEPAHELIRLLVKRGADIDQPDAAGKTALDVARERNDEPTLALLTRLRDGVLRARARAAEAARIAAEKEAEARRIEAEQEAARAKRSATAKKAAETRRLAAEAAADAKRIAAEKRAAEAARIAAEREAEAKRLADAREAEARRRAAGEEAARAKRSAAARKAAETKRLAAAEKAAEAERRSAARGAAKAKRTASSKRAAKPKGVAPVRKTMRSKPKAARKHWPQSARPPVKGPANNRARR